MKQRRIEELNRIREEGKKAALEGSNHTENPYRYMNGTYWYMGWEDGQAQLMVPPSKEVDWMLPSMADGS